MQTGKDWSRRDFVSLLAAGSGLILIELGALSATQLEALAESGVDTSEAKPEGGAPGYNWEQHYWGYVVDVTKCIGCCACMRACRAENDVPSDYARTWVERYQVMPDGHVIIDTAKGDDHIFDEGNPEAVAGFFVPKLCNHCEATPCTQVCPVGAAYYTKDGVSLVDPKRCMGCGYCVQACPYGSRFMNPMTHVADKCTLCYHRITKGDVPACVASCPREARIFGDLRDPESKISKLLASRGHQVLKPGAGTKPKCYYIGLDREVK
ncbi:MAG: 4Fe-4S dicluster domain-containing protein [Candidatus Sericytochromatia bacterium]|nr:4Fe-4S dicluster domain-containing protein [Candidatus Tanganyikabacteria bacterium]